MYVELVPKRVMAGDEFSMMKICTMPFWGILTHGELEREGKRKERGREKG